MKQFNNNVPIREAILNLGLHIHLIVCSFEDYRALEDSLGSSVQYCDIKTEEIEYRAIQLGNKALVVPSDELPKGMYVAFKDMNKPQTTVLDWALNQKYLKEY
jgi:hypothetical protein